MKKLFTIIAVSSSMLTSVFSLSSCTKDDIPSKRCFAEDLVYTVYDISKTADNTSKAIDLETYWEGEAVYGTTVMKTYLKFEVVAFNCGTGREVCKVKGEDNIYSDRKFSFVVNEGELTLTFNDDNSKVVIPTGSWSVDNKGSYEKKLYATFTNNGQSVTWNRLSKMSYWSDTSLLNN